LSEQRGQESMAAAAGWFERSGDERGVLRLAAGGRWDVLSAARLDAELRELLPPPGTEIRLDLGGVERLDTAGALVVNRALRRWRGAEVRADVANVEPPLRTLLEQSVPGAAPATEERRPASPLAPVGRLGEGTLTFVAEARGIVAFLGLVSLTLLRVARDPRRLRFTALAAQLQRTGLAAMPIVGLISFLIGVVLAYQGVEQLRLFGAQIYVVDLVGLSVLREVGILLTAIIVAGRSGSAFTAQIGTMQVREEVDAMRTIGLDPIEVLVLPRLVALVVALPLLGFFADVMGLVGAALVSYVAAGIPIGQFFERLPVAVSMGSFWVGIVKAPVFAALIALVGCYQGFRVSGSAEAVGSQTTVSVVHSIFLVIVVDALFSILFTSLGI
jgi:phospholipid/cholesterol/gamma-HCH transport system permease protein